MKIFKEIFARIWALWALLSFIITFALIFLPSMVCYLIPEPKGQAVFIWLARVWMRVWLGLVGCQVKVSGREYFEEGEEYIVTFNHNTLLDVPLSAPFVPGPNKTIAKKSFVKVPLFGFYYAKGSVLVDRHSEASRISSFEQMKATLRNKMHMSIYPEGTRNRTGNPLKKFYSGAFKLAVATKKSIIPCLLFNTAKAMPNNKFFYFLPAKLEMHFLPPISSKNISSEALKETVFNTMKEYYINHSKN